MPYLTRLIKAKIQAHKLSGKLALLASCLSSSLLAAPAQAFGLEGVFAPVNWNFIISVTNNTESPATTDFKTYLTADVNCPVQFSDEINCLFIDLTAPSGSFYIAGSDVEGSQPQAVTDNPPIDLYQQNRQVQNTWELILTTDAAISFNYLFETGDTSDSDKGFFAINGNKNVGFQTSTSSESGSYDFSNLKSGDVISFGVLSQNNTGTPGYLTISNLNFTEVPAPLPLMGAAAAFGWSRRLRSRIKQPKI